MVFGATGLNATWWKVAGYVFSALTGDGDALTNLAQMLPIQTTATSISPTIISHDLFLNREGLYFSRTFTTHSV